VVDDGQKQTHFAEIAVFQGGRQIGTMYPGRSVFRKHEDQEARTDVAIRRSLAQDLYLVLTPDIDLGTQTITLQVVVNPLVDWIWLGFAVLAIGTGIALMPERAYSFAVARAPSEAAATSASMFVAAVGAVLLSGAPVLAQGHVEDPTAAVTPPKNALEEQLRHEMGCVCGTCAHEALSKCTCGTAQRMRAELREQVDLGKSRDEILAHFIQVYGGQQFLTAPIDRGFNRLAWLLPYGVAASGAVIMGLIAVRWSRRRQPDGASPAPIDPAIEERLDDELRDLD
jgi:cytochrome c-type biogenesis protein CcmH/NrfF